MIVSSWLACGGTPGRESRRSPALGLGMDGNEKQRGWKKQNLKGNKLAGGWYSARFRVDLGRVGCVAAARLGTKRIPIHSGSAGSNRQSEPGRANNSVWAEGPD